MSVRRQRVGGGVLTPERRPDGDRPTRFRVHFRLSPSMITSVEHRVVSEGYGLRGKQKWYRAQIWRFIDPATWGGRATREGANYRPWLRIIVDNSLLSLREARNQYVELTQEEWVSLLKVSLDAAYYGYHMEEDPIYFEPAVSDVIHGAVVWALGQPAPEEGE